MTLSLEDIAWHRSVGQMIDALDQANFWTQLVRLLDQYVPFDSWVVLLFASEHKPLVFAECPGQDGEPDHRSQNYLNGPYLLDPFYIASREHSRTGLFRLAEVAPEHFELTEYYQRYFRLNVVADEIQFNCQLPDGRTLCLSLGSKQRFGREQIALLSLIQPWVLSLLRQRLPYELNQVSAAEPPLQNDDWGAQLTTRELDVGRLMLSGCSSKEIDRKPELTLETVKVPYKP